MLTPPHRFAGEAPACTARDRSWSSATGSPVTPPRRWVPGSVLGPLAWASGRNVKGMRRHIGPLHSGYRPPPLAPSRGPLAPVRRCSGASARRRRRRLSAVDLRPPATLASGCRRQAAARRYAAAPAPRSPRYALRAARTAPALGPPVALGLLRVSLRLTLRATAGSLPALLRRSLGGSPQDGPCSSRLVGRSPPSAVSAGLRAPLLPPGAWSGPEGRFLRPPAPGVGADTAGGCRGGPGRYRPGNSRRRFTAAGDS